MAGERRSASMRLRITAVAALAVFVVLSATGVILVLVQRDQLTDSLYDNLEQRGDDLARTLAVGGDLEAAELGRNDDDTFSRIVPDGEALPQAPDGFVTLVMVDVVDSDGQPVTLVLGASTEDVDDATRALTVSFIVAVPVVTVLLALVVWFLAGRTLRPVEAIRSRVDEISGSRLDGRVPEPGSGDEIDRLAKTMNRMLDRLEAANLRQQQFTADASHELRTPLTRMRSEIEVELAGPEAGLSEPTAEDVLVEIEGLERLVGDLLELARLDSRTEPLHTDTVDLDDIVFREVQRYRAGAGPRIDTSQVSAGAVSGDRAQLTRVVRNLLDNAVRHARSQARISLHEVGDQVRLDVSDDGPGIPPDRREVVFERFGRTEDDRGAETGGTGLGLAIAREIAERHSGTIAVVEKSGDGALPGAHLQVVLPAADVAAGPR